MKHKTAELEGVLLDAAVAKAEGLEYRIESWMTNPPKPGRCYIVTREARYRDRSVGVMMAERVPIGLVDALRPFSPSADWADGGPIIERERISIVANGSTWDAGFDCEASGLGVSLYPHQQTGPTPLIAAMRAYVASRFGDEVELP